METFTLGKRIAFHRKRMGMTQEQLAERVGVSPQAVSKWEHDLSCPDISTLPTLAEIFGVTTDELLGNASAKQSVHAAEVVNKKDSERHVEINVGTRAGLWFAIYILFIGSLFLARAIVPLDISPWRILWASALFIGGVGAINRKYPFFPIGVSLVGAYFLLAAIFPQQFSLGWSIVIPICLLYWGISLLVDVLRGKHKIGSHVTVNGEKPQERHEYRCENGDLFCEEAFGSRRTVVSSEMLHGGSVDTSFGDYVLDFSECATVSEDCRLSVEVSFGNLTMLIPERFCVKLEGEETRFSGINISGKPAINCNGYIIIEPDVSFGGLKIKYI